MHLAGCLMTYRRRRTRAGHDVLGMGRSSHLESPGPDSEFLVLAPGGIQARAFQVLKLLGLARAVAPASDCAPVDRLQLDNWPVEVRTVV